MGLVQTVRPVDRNLTVGVDDQLSAIETPGGDPCSPTLRRHVTAKVRSRLQRDHTKRVSQSVATAQARPRSTQRMGSPSSTFRSIRSAGRSRRPLSRTASTGSTPGASSSRATSDPLAVPRQPPGGSRDQHPPRPASRLQGASPYLQAFERRVKIIGATAHFVDQRRAVAAKNNLERTSFAGGGMGRWHRRSYEHLRPPLFCLDCAPFVITFPKSSIR